MSQHYGKTISCYTPSDKKRDPLQSVGKLQSIDIETGIRNVSLSVWEVSPQLIQQTIASLPESAELPPSFNSTFLQKKTSYQICRTVPAASLAVSRIKSALQLHWFFLLGYEKAAVFTFAINAIAVELDQGLIAQYFIGLMASWRFDAHINALFIAMLTEKSYGIAYSYTPISDFAYEGYSHEWNSRSGDAEGNTKH